MRKSSYHELERIAKVSITHMITGDKGMPVYQESTNICPLPLPSMFIGYYKDGLVSIENEPIKNELHTRLYDFVNNKSGKESVCHIAN